MNQFEPDPAGTVFDVRASWNKISFHQITNGVRKTEIVNGDSVVLMSKGTLVFVDNVKVAKNGTYCGIVRSLNNDNDLLTGAVTSVNGVLVGDIVVFNHQQIAQCI